MMIGTKLRENLQTGKIGCNEKSYSRAISTCDTVVRLPAVMYDDGLYRTIKISDLMMDHL